MGFSSMQARLAGVVRERVASGAATERGLARAIGVSQPHLHHILKGARSLTPGIADRLLRHLDLDLADLGETPPAAQPHHRDVPVLDGYAGPGHRFPALTDVAGRYPFPACEVARLARPCVVRAGYDPALAGRVDAGDLLLLDCAAGEPVESAWYLVAEADGCLMRRVRTAGARYGLSAAPAGRPDGYWSWRPLLHLSVLEIVCARVVWIGKSLEQVPPARPAEAAGVEH